MAMSAAATRYVPTASCMASTYRFQGFMFMVTPAAAMRCVPTASCMASAHRFQGFRFMAMSAATRCVPTASCMATHPVWTGSQNMLLAFHVLPRECQLLARASATDVGRNKVLQFPAPLAQLMRVYETDRCLPAASPTG